MVAIIRSLQQQIASKEEPIQFRDARIEILEELLRHKKIQQFAARSEKQLSQITLFEEAELEVGIHTLRERIKLTIYDEKKPVPSRPSSPR